MKIPSKQVPHVSENSQTHSLLVNYPTSLLHVIETICYTVKINNNLCVKRWRSERMSEWVRAVENTNGVYTQWFSSECFFSLVYCCLVFTASFLFVCLLKRKGFAHRYSIHSFGMHSIREIRSGEFWPFYRCYYCFLFFFCIHPVCCIGKKKVNIFISSFFFPVV